VRTNVASVDVVAGSKTIDPADLARHDDAVDLMCRRAREVSVATARLLEAVVAVADLAAPGFEADEVAFALAWTQAGARSQVELGRYLIRTLPDVFAALRSGAIDERRAWTFFDVLAVVDDDIARDIAGRLVPLAPTLTTSQLRDRLRRAVLKADPDATKRVAKSVSDRYVACQSDQDGTASLFGTRLPAARAVAAFERVDAYARGRKYAGDERTLDQLRADTFLDLLEGVGVGAAPVHRAGVVELTIPWTAATGATNDPGLLSGFGPIDADSAREIIVESLRRAISRDATVEWRHTLTSDDGDLIETTRIRTPRARPPVESRPDRRRPGRQLARWVTTRDRTCRAPGCRVPARAADIDHTVEHSAGGPTSHDNLAVVCRHHHRLRHDGGWGLDQPDAGTLDWTSPTGHTYRREPDPP
jgi:hypothetical protein